MEKKISYFVVPFILFFLFSVLIINWQRIGWFFDWETWRRAEEEVELVPTNQDQEGVEPVPVNQDQGEEAVGAPNMLIIPSLGVEAPLRLPDSTEESVLTAELDRGVVLYPGTSPGEKGRAVILGHSAPPGYPDIRFDRVFSDLGNLVNGDRIEVYHNERLFVYLVDRVETMSIEQYDDFLLSIPEYDYMLVISTCYPPGKNWQRWVAVTHLLTE